MNNAAIINFKPSGKLRVDARLEDRIHRALDEFSKSGSFQTAERFRKIALPESELAESSCLVDGRWIAEVRYDNLLHEGEGPTEATALVDAVLKIVAAIKT